MTQTIFQIRRKHLRPQYRCMQGSNPSTTLSEDRTMVRYIASSSQHPVFRRIHRSGIRTLSSLQAEVVISRTPGTCRTPSPDRHDMPAHTLRPHIPGSHYQPLSDQFVFRRNHEYASVRTFRDAFGLNTPYVLSFRKCSHESGKDSA
ncbi:MAG: hypothetical protein C5S49_01990 [Candidatus Methanogaster sp.]|nr:MAG: hypothetical protein C5S49_01990 [ANME-2 cluster archaeon]